MSILLYLITSFKFRLQHLPALPEPDLSKEPPPMTIQACLANIMVKVDDALRYRLAEDLSTLAPHDVSDMDIWFHSQLIAPPVDSADTYKTA